MTKKIVTGSLVILLAVVLTVAITLFVFLKGGAGKKEHNPLADTMNQPFTAAATIRLDGATVVADINRSNPNAMTLSVTEPPALKDLSFVYDGKEISVHFKEMQVNIADDSLVAKTATGIIMHAINSAGKDSGVSISEEDGVVRLQGKSDDSSFSLQVDKESGSILNLSVPEMDLECSFSDFSFGLPQEEVPEE